MALTQHTQFNPDDLAYLRARGWTDQEIKARWDAEAAEGKAPCGWDTESAKAKLAATLRK